MMTSWHVMRNVLRLRSCSAQAYFLSILHINTLTHSYFLKFIQGSSGSQKIMISHKATFSTVWLQTKAIHCRVLHPNLWPTRFYEPGCQNLKAVTTNGDPPIFVWSIMIMLPILVIYLYIDSIILFWYFDEVSFSCINWCTVVYKCVCTALNTWTINI